MLCRPTNDVTVVALLPLAFVLVELPRRRSLALAIHCLLAFVIAAVGKWCSNCTCAQHIGIKAARGEEVIACDGS